MQKFLPQTEKFEEGVRVNQEGNEHESFACLI